MIPGGLPDEILKYYTVNSTSYRIILFSFIAYSFYSKGLGHAKNKSLYVTVHYYMLLEFAHTPL